jgi:hypothetical protein
MLSSLRRYGSHGQLKLRVDDMKQGRTRLSAYNTTTRSDRIRPLVNGFLLPNLLFLSIIDLLLSKYYTFL